MRIIAGSAKGREIAAPKGKRTRPTLAKVKEAMFGMIQFDIDGARVLDLFAGSGALGLEALSRGADYTVFCDADRQAAGVVKANINKLGFESRSRLYCCDSLSLIKTLGSSGERFSIALLDPPYETELYEKAIELLLQEGLLLDGAIILCEHPSGKPPKLSDSRLVSKEPRRYGDTAVSYITFAERERV